MKVVFVVLIMAVCLMWGYNVGTLEPRVTSTNNDVMQAVCDASYTADNGGLEEACGIAQDASGSNYTPTIGLIADKEK